MGVSIADSGIVSVMAVLIFLAESSELIDCFMSATALGFVFSSILKLALLVAKLASVLLSFRKPH